MAGRSGTSGTTSTSGSNLGVALLSVTAAANLAIGVWQSLQPGRLTDFYQVTSWIRQWYIGVDSYAHPSVADYPPWALVVLTPLGAIPPQFQAICWIAVNAGLAIVLAVHLSRLTGEPSSVRSKLVALLLMAAAFRTLNQFSLFALVVALAGATISWGWLGMLILGVGLIKPQIGGAVALWTLLGGRAPRVLLAALVPFVVTTFYAERLFTTAMTILTEYAVVIRSVYGHEIPFLGHTDLKAWIVAVWPSMPSGLWLSAAIAAALLVPAIVAIVRRRGALDRDLELLAYCGVVSLLAARHLSYDLVLVLPALAAWRIAPFSSDRRTSRIVKAMFLVVAAWLVLDPGGIGRRLLPAMHAPAFTSAILTQADRVLCLFLWGVLSFRLIARHDTRARPPRAPA